MVGQTLLVDDRVGRHESQKHPDFLADSARVTVDVVTAEARFSELESEWNALASTNDSPFLTFTWTKTWWDCFGTGKRLHIVVVRDGLGLVAIAPLMISERRIYGWRFRALEFIANVHTPRSDFLVRPGSSVDFYSLIWSRLWADRQCWDILLLCQLQQDSPTLEKLSQYAREARLSSGCWQSAESPYISLAGGWESYCGSLNTKHRVNLRRRLRRLTEMGKVEVEYASCDSDLPSSLEEAFRLEGAAWKSATRTAMCSEAAVKKFYTLLAERFAEQGWIKLHFLKLNGQRIAMQYAVAYNSRAYSLKPGYDPAYATYSPSNLLLMLFLEEASREGITEYDLLGVKEEWKMQWTKSVRAHYWLFVFADALMPRLAHYVKFVLIPGLRRRSHWAPAAAEAPCGLEGLCAAKL